MLAYVECNIYMPYIRMYSNTVTSGNTYGNHPEDPGQLVGERQR